MFVLCHQLWDGAIQKRNALTLVLPFNTLTLTTKLLQFYSPAFIYWEWNSHGPALPIVPGKNVWFDQLQEQGIMGGEWQMEQGDWCALRWLDSDCVLAVPGLLCFHFAAWGHGEWPAGDDRERGVATCVGCMEIYRRFLCFTYEPHYVHPLLLT